MKLTRSVALLSIVALASAAPMKLGVYSKGTDGEYHPLYRVGHAGGHHPKAIEIPDVAPVAPLSPPELDAGEVSILPFIPVPAAAEPAPHRHTGKPCSKSIALSNWMREMVGMPTIETTEVIHVRPGSTPEVVRIKIHAVGVTDVPSDEDHHHHHSEKKQKKKKQKAVVAHAKHNAWHDRPFSDRLTHALVSLGRWEGRFVAFVLGCGIGVLLRLAWVITVVTVRSFRCSRAEEEDEHEHDAPLTEEEQRLLPPPGYVDEKQILERVIGY